MKQRIYFAHSKKIYHTDQETAYLEYFKKRFPNSSLVNPSDCKLSIDECLVLVELAHVVVCAEYMDHIGHGQYTEIQLALSLNKNVWVIRQWSKPTCNGFRLLKVKGIEIVDELDWGIRYGKIITGICHAS